MSSPEFLHSSTKLIPSLKLDVAWLQEVLQGSFPGSSVQVTSISELTEAAVGYMSAIRRVRLHWDGEATLGAPQTVVIKIPMVKSAVEAWEKLGEGQEVEQCLTDVADIMMAAMHDVECNTYAHFKEHANIAPSQVPHIYATERMNSGRPIIVMEDFNNCQTVSIHEGFTEEQRFLSKATLTRDFPMFTSMNAGFGTMLVNIAEQLRGAAPELFARLPEIKDLLLSDWWQDTYEAVKSGKQVGVLAHGDLWSPQILWKDGMLRGVVDWQVSHPGALTEDLNRVLYTCTRVEIRRRITQKLLDYYYSELKKKLSAKGLKLLFSREQLQEDYRQNLKYTCCMTVFAVGMWSNSTVTNGSTEEESNEKRFELFTRLASLVDETLDVLNENKIKRTMEDSENLVPNSDLDVLWVKTTLEYEFPGSNCKVVSVKELGPDAFGYMSAMRRITLHWDSNDKNLPASLILKVFEGLERRGESQVPNVSKASDAWGEGNSTDDQAKFVISMLHAMECRAYNVFRRRPDHGLKVPRTFAVADMTSNRPVILMEDCHPCKTLDFVQGFNEDQLYQIVEEIANYHIFSFTHDGWEHEMGATEEEFTHMNYFPGLVKSMASSLPGQSADHFKLLPEVSERILNNNWFEDFMRRFFNDDQLKSLAHGDLWATQILWRGRELVGVVDWQQSHPGSLTEDLQRVLYTCTSIEVRRRLTNPLLEILFDKVKSTLEDRGFEMPYTWPQLLKDYDETLPYTCGLTVFSAAMWANSEVIKGKTDEETAKRKLEIFDRTDACMLDTVTLLRAQAS